MPYKFKIYINLKDNINPIMQESISKMENNKPKVCYSLIVLLHRINEITHINYVIVLIA